jgi:hypothetical protein
MQFVPQTGTKDEDPTTRKLIRRHVMLGKNEGRTPNHLKQPTQHGTAVFRMRQPLLDRSLLESIPQRVGSDFSGLDFADDVAPPLMNETLQFCTVTNESLYVLEPCIFFGSEDPVAMCLQPLACDALYLNVMVFSTPRTANGKAILQHYGRSISILRSRIAGAEIDPSGVSDLTIMAVLLLALHALIIGDFQNARFHALGLNKLVNMKDGGILSFKDKTKQMIEILR